MQVWRSADGFSWEQVGVAGLGDSNNVMPYYDNSAGEFLGRLYVGTGNPPNGGELWRKAVTADMVGTPTRGPAPLTVSFTNQSAGDYTSSQWDFGDGTTSTVTSPIHVYAAGVYSVTLTVSDGLDSNTLVRQNYIRALPPLHLPLVAQGLDPLLYDAFEDPTFDGAYDPAFWQFAGSTTYQMRQEDGVLVFPPSGAPAKTGAVLGVLRHPQRSLHELRQLEARLKMSTDRGGGFAFVKIQISSPDIAGHGWWTQCMLATAGEWQPYVLCDVVTYNGAGAGPEYLTPKVQAQFDRWYTVKILADPETGALAYYLDDALIGTHAPADAPALRAATNLEARVGVWNEEPNGFISRSIDDVRITGGRQ